MSGGTEQPIGDISRLAELGGIFARHGAKSLGNILGITPHPDADITPEQLRPKSTVALLRDIGPVGVKLGQLLATRGDLFSDEWIDALASLQDRVEPLPFTSIEPVLVASWGENWEEEFTAFEREPMASASIAQTYAATLPDGSDVIVKVRRPGPAARLEADMRLLVRLAGATERRSSDIARYRPVEFLQTFGKNLTREMDLAAEARACERIGGYLETLGAKTPVIHWHLTGLRVNVQERLPGIPASQIDRATDSEHNAVFARRYADAVLRMMILNGEFHGDPHPGNVFRIAADKVGFIDFGAIGFLSGARRQEIIRLIFGIADEQTEDVADLLLHWADNPAVDRGQFAIDLGQLIEEFRGTVLSGIEFSVIFDRVFGLLREYRLVLPPDLAILLRTLLTAEGFVRAFAPDYNIAEETKPIVIQLLSERFSLGATRDQLTKLRRRLFGLSASLPDLIDTVTAIAKTGAIPVKVDPSSFEQLDRPQQQNQSVKGPVVAALIVSAALLADQSIVLAAITLSFALVALVRKWN